MTAFLRRLVARAGVGGEGEQPPAPAGGVRPRVAARFEPSGAGPPPDVDAVYEPAPSPPRGPGAGPGPGWREPPPVHRGVLVAPTGEVPSVRPVPHGVVREATPLRPPAPVGGARPGEGAESRSAPRPREAPAPAPAVAPPVPSPVPAVAAADRRPPPSPPPAPGPERGGHRRPAGEPSSPPPRRPAPAVRPAPPVAPAPVVRPRPRQDAADPAPAAEPVVHVTIGRVEIRTAPARPDGATPRRPAPEPGAATGLEEYLAARAGGR